MSVGKKVIPPGHQVHQLTLRGTSPLLMSSADVDRESAAYQEYRALSRKSKKSLEDEARLRELEWYARLYYDKAVGVFIPGKTIKELLRSAATKWKKGEDVKRSLVVPDYRIPLIYEGPKEPPELWAQGFRYTTMVANGGASRGRVERTRPCFDTWALTCLIAFDPEDLDLGDVVRFVDRSQKYGLGDYRPEFGAFEAELEFVKEQREPVRANGHKPRDRKLEDAIKQHHKRITATV